MAFWSRFRRRRPTPRALGIHRVDSAVPCFLVELAIEHSAAPFTIAAFHQPDPKVPTERQQVPYDAKFLNADGDQIIGDLMLDGSAPGYWQGTVRLAFFLHLLDPQRPLESPFGDIALPRPTPWPKRLRVMRYETPD
jgi:hypothetical protein